MPLSGTSGLLQGGWSGDTQVFEFHNSPWGQHSKPVSSDPTRDLQAPQQWKSVSALPEGLSPDGQQAIHCLESEKLSDSFSLTHAKSSLKADPLIRFKTSMLPFEIASSSRMPWSRVDSTCKTGTFTVRSSRSLAKTLLVFC